MKFFITACGALLTCLLPSTLFCMENTSYSTYQPQPLSIVYSPWRENYVSKIPNTQQIEKMNISTHCPFCHIISTNDIKKDHILYHGKDSLIKLASQPYIENGIHFLIVPYEHTREISNLSANAYDEENILTQKLCLLFSQNCHEICINTNQGSSAGASVPNHHHKHIIINKGIRYYNLIHALQSTKETITLDDIFTMIQPQCATLTDMCIPENLHTGCKEKCYYCTIIKKDAQENLIIHRGKHTSTMLSHYPTYFGEIDIIPHDHIESLETMPTATYNEINNVTLKIYPLLLKILKAQDSNIGLISYGPHATHPQHIQQKLIPRKHNAIKSPITKSNHLNANIKQLYHQLVSEWKLLQLYNDNFISQSSHL